MSFIHGHVVNLYISYKLDTWSRDLKIRNRNYLTIKINQE